MSYQKNENKKILGPKTFLDETYFHKICLSHKILVKKNWDPKIGCKRRFCSGKFFVQKNFRVHEDFGSKIISFRSNKNHWSLVFLFQVTTIFCIQKLNKKCFYYLIQKMYSQKIPIGEIFISLVDNSRPGQQKIGLKHKTYVDWTNISGTVFPY